jgi:hypothetical protein
MLTSQGCGPTDNDDGETKSDVDKVGHTSSRFSDRSIKSPFVPVYDNT